MKLFTLGILLALAASYSPADEKPTDAGGVVVDKAGKRVLVDAKIAPRKLEHLKGEVYPIEVVACWPHPKGKKAHETVVTIDANPSAVAAALESLGLKHGAPVRGGDVPPTGPEILVYLEFQDPTDKSVKKISLQKMLVDPKTKKPFPKDVTFRFTGSVMTQADPAKPEKTYGADLTGTLIAVYPVTDETVLQSSLTSKQEKYLKLETNPDNLPKEGTPVKLVLEAK